MVGRRRGEKLRPKCWREQVESGAGEAGRGLREAGRAVCWVRASSVDWQWLWFLPLSIASPCCLFAPPFQHTSPPLSFAFFCSQTFSLCDPQEERNKNDDKIMEATLQNDAAKLRALIEKKKHTSLLCPDDQGRVA